MKKIMFASMASLLLLAAAAPACNYTGGFGFGRSFGSGYGYGYGINTVAFSPVVITTPVIAPSVAAISPILGQTPSAAQGYAAAPAFQTAAPLATGQAIVGAGCGVGASFLGTQTLLAVPLVSTVLATPLVTPFVSYRHGAFFANDFGSTVGFHRSATVVNQRGVKRVR